MSMCKYLDHLEKVLGGTYLVISIKLFLIIIAQNTKNNRVVDFFKFYGKIYKMPL